MTLQSIPVDVVRALSAAPELRAAAPADGSIGLLSGHFSAFGNWYQVSSYWEGDFLESTAAGFTAQTIAEDRDGMRVLFDHGFDAIGNKVLGPIQDLREDEIGPYYEVPLFDTSYNRDLLPGLKAGVYGASFRMRVIEDSWNEEPDPSDYNPKALPERTITRARVMEFGPVTFPANPEATASVRSASVRSVTDQFYERLRSRDQGAFEDAVRAAGRNPTDLTGRADARSAPGGGSKDSRPGNGGASARSEAEARHHQLILTGVLRNAR